MARHGLLAVFFGLIFSATAGSAASDIAGTWQGSWQTIPRVVKIERAPRGGYRGQMYSLGEWQDHGPLNGYTISPFRPRGDSVVFTVDRMAGIFDGTLSKDGKHLVGTWREGGRPPATMNLARASKADGWTIDPSPHTSRFVQVDKNVSLEVLDWGGSGPPLILLAGGGDTAHIFDKFALDFTAKHHVYGITRRGFGISSAPAPTDANYAADRLGDDVLAVIDALKLDRPVIAGHSLAGEELSSIGSRHPEKVSGLIYLDAAYGYAFYEPKVGPLPHSSDFAIVHSDLARLQYAGPAQTQVLTDEILAILPNLQKDLQAVAEQRKGQPEPPPQLETPDMLIARAIMMNARKYTNVTAPVLAILAVPHACAPHCDSAGAKDDAARMPALADALQADHPTARFVRLPFAEHEVWNSNEADVVREMNAFMDELPKR